MKTIQIGDKSFQMMISKDQIEDRIREMAANINQAYAGREVVLLCVLKGSILFSADIMRHLQMPLTLDFIRLSSYGTNTQSSGKIQEIMGAASRLEGKHVIVIEDIVDSGLTLEYLRKDLQEKGVASAAVVSLLYKPGNFKGLTPPDYYGFDIADAFVVGYGMDYAEHGRQYDAVYQLSAAHV